jgi:aryl-phospho-beta-D-glucosidase BglC (GH1 family)
MLKTVTLLGVLSFQANAAEPWRPETRWRGFNLLGMFMSHGQQGEFPEEDFQLISELRFNFVRLPMDYRFWIKDGDWEKIDEAKLAPVDAAVALGKKYNIHVQLCFHRAPGYTVAKPPEARDLFKDQEALRVCCKHWAFFARRYKGIPNEELSFNLFNEPGEVEEEAYEKVGTALVRAIRMEDPGRFIVADGIAWGSRPCQAFFKLGVGQAMRGYKPMSISHYMASWVGTPSDEPVWPPAPAVSPLYGPGKAPLNIPLVIEDAPAGTLTFRPGMVSGKVCFRVEADGERLLECELEPKQGPGWTNVVYKSEWKIAQGHCLSELQAGLPKAAKRLTVSITKGDWAGLSWLRLTGEDGHAATLNFDQSWGKTNAVIRFAGFAAKPAFHREGYTQTGADYVRDICLGPWQSAFDAGVYTMVGEFGAFQYTPHAITLEWMEDNLRLWKERGLGWALWNFRGSFGVLDSGRKDVTYETFHGHKLDRKMLELLQRY